MPVPTNQALDIAGDYDTHFHIGIDEVEKDGILRLSKESIQKSHFPEFLPAWDPKEKYPPLSFYKYEDPALRADTSFPNLFKADSNVTVSKITPKFGTEIKGLQLTELNAAGKDELALLVAERGVVILRDQDFASKGPSYVEEYGSHFGKLHIHHTSGAPEGHPYLHITYRRPDPKEFNRIFDEQHSSIRFHTDVSYELQPPSYTFFSVLEGPEGGGDTLFSDSAEAFNRLSPTFQEFLSSLHVLHSSFEQAESSRGQGGIQRRAPVKHIHPLIRVHPVLGTKSIFVNKMFSRRIIELKPHESDILLNFLCQLMENTQDLQLRARWEPGTVTVWDNRRVHHSAVVDWEEPVLRHAFRVTPHGERPVEDLKYLNDESYYPPV